MTAFIHVSRFWRWVIGVVFFVLIIYFSLQLVVNQNLNPILEDVAKNGVKDGSDELYKIDFEDFDFNLATTTLTLKNFSLTHDTIRYNELIKVDSASPFLFKLRVPKVRIYRINIYNVFFGKKLDINGITLEDPVLEILHDQSIVKADTTPFDPNSLFSGHFNTVQINKVALENLTIDHKSKKNEIVKLLKIGHVNLKLYNLNLDTTLLNDPDRLLYTDDFEFSIDNYTTNLPDSLYKISIKKIGFSQSKKSAYIDSLEIVPRLSAKQFFKKVGKETDRIIVSNKSIILEDIHVGELMNRQNLIASLMTVKDTEIKAYRDKRYPEDLERRPPTLHKFLKNLDFKLHIDTIKVLRTNIAYAEQGKDSEVPGHITFQDLYATIYNFSNDSAVIATKDLIMDAQTLLFNQSLLKVNVVFDIKNPKGAYYMNGSLNSLRLGEFNKLIEPMASINIEEGRLKKASFKVFANDHSAHGKMDFLYDDLKIKILDKEGEEGLKQKITSFVANNFVVKTNNPHNGNLREGDIYFERDISRSMFHYWGRIALTGVASSVGISQNKMNKSDPHAKESKNNRSNRRG